MRPHHGPHGHIHLPEIALDEDAPLSYRVHHLMRRVMRAQKQFMFHRLGEKGTHPGQAITLWVLSDNDGMTQSELAEMLSVARPTVTVMLKKMEEAGLLERRRDEADRRFHRIYLTDTGRELHASLQAVHAQVVDVTVGSMTDREQEDLIRLLETVERNLIEAQTEGRDA